MKKILPIKDFKGYYIDTCGKVYSNIYHFTHNPDRKIKTLKEDKVCGYLCVQLVKDKKIFSKRIHRLVAEAFIPNPDNKPEVNHKNGIKTDNRVKNLEWVTRSENMKHAYKVLGYSGVNKNKIGEKNHRSKKILQLKEGVVVAEFYGSGEAARKTGINRGSINRCCNKNIKMAGGFSWKYEEQE